MKKSVLITTQVLSLVVVPVVVIASIVNFAPPSVAKFFLNPNQLRAIIEHDQKNAEEQSAKKAKELIKSDIANATGNLLHNALDPSLGNTTNPAVTIVEYIDYKCGYCKKAHEELHKLLASEKYKGKVRVIVKNYPVIGGEISLYAAEVATGFYKAHPEKFSELHDKLFASPLASAKEVDDIVHSFGEKPENLKSDEIRNSIIANFNFAREINVAGTPAFIIGDEFIGGFASYEQLTAKVDEKINGKKK